MKRRTGSTATIVMAFWLLGACGLVPHPNLRPPSVDASPALEVAVARFYAATDPAGMRGAVQEALNAAPDHPMTHEIAAQLAAFELRRGDRFDHLHDALLDPRNRAAHLHLAELWSLPYDRTQALRFEGLVRTLAAEHPDPELRAAAHQFIGRILWDKGSARRGRAHIVAHTGTLPMAWIGVWDNDQGKGFDEIFPPEREIRLDARYQGQIVEIGWRSSPPQDAVAMYDLVEMFTPDDWTIAYGTAVVRGRPGPHELRLQTGDPIKVWFNGTLVFSDRELEGASILDQLIIPIRLTGGADRVLIKSAQRTGRWSVSSRITGPEGVTPDALEPLDPMASEAPPAGGAEATVSIPSMMERRIAGLQGSELRRQYHRIRWLKLMGALRLAVEATEMIHGDHPNSLVFGRELYGSYWNRQERGQTADVLGRMFGQVGEEFPLIAQKQARFWRQQDLSQKAHEVLASLLARRPDLADAHAQMADYFDGEGWNEERCRSLEAARARDPKLTDLWVELAACWADLGYAARARALYEEVLEATPGRLTVSWRLLGMAEREERSFDAEALAHRLTDLQPESPWPWFRLGALHRHHDDPDGAARAYQRGMALDPDAVTPYIALGEMALERNDLEETARWWGLALARDPENDSLARRLAHLMPRTKEPWAEDIPPDEVLQAALGATRDLEPPQGADVVYMLAHEVTMLNADGSTSGIVTEVIHALNEQGQDQITSYTLQRGGAQRILQAYAVNPDGRRVEAEALREGKVRFRGLVPRATVVMQYRYDASSLPYLRQSLYRIQWFQGYGEAIGFAAWSLWLDGKTVLHESVAGPIQREESPRGDLRRVTWSVQGAPPIIGEPSMPPAREVLNHVAVSTVPDWDTFMRWESALLEGAFRSSPELEATARKIVEGAGDTLEKVLRIHRYLMEEVRYEQDYENSIAGVKPHSATTVLERRYGDCKDKSVLFITLARALDIDVHFAILLTRNRGAIYAGVPAQQFNHAIVYVPEQPGMPEGRFYDATADALDVDVLRHDVVGVTALVHDPTNHQSTWRDIPFQAPSFNAQRLRFTVDLAANGNATGQFFLYARGQIGASIRRFARNRAQFERGIDGMLGRFFPGNNTGDREYLEVSDPTRPAEVRVGFEAPGVARLEGQRLAFKPPQSFVSDLINKFSLSERRWDLLMGAPSVFELRFEVRAPDGWRIAKAPKSRTLETSCFTFARTTTRKGKTVTLGYRFVRTCERIPVDQYQAHRRFAKAMEQAYGDAVSFRR